MTSHTIYSLKSQCIGAVCNLYRVRSGIDDFTEMEHNSLVSSCEQLSHAIENVIEYMEYLETRLVAIEKYQPALMKLAGIYIPPTDQPTNGRIGALEV